MFVAGFTTSDTSCCGVDTKVGGLCLPDSTPCRDRKAYVFWDAYHPTDRANELIALETLKRLNITVVANTTSS